MSVQEIMSSPVITVAAEHSIMEAGKLMKENQIKHLAVLDPQGLLVGVVTDRDLKRASASDATALEIHELLYLLQKIQVKKVMKSHPVTISPQDTPQRAATLMVEHGIGCLPVLKGEQLDGIVTKNDLLRLLANQAG